MVRFLEVFATGGLEMNAKEIMTNYNIEVICRTSLGVEPNCFSNSDDDHLTQMVCFVFIEYFMYKNSLVLILYILFLQ